MPVDLSNYINYVHKRAPPYKKISSGVEFVFKVSVLQLNVLSRRRIDDKFTTICFSVRRHGTKVDEDREHTNFIPNKTKISFVVILSSGLFLIIL